MLSELERLAREATAGPAWVHREDARDELKIRLVNAFPLLLAAVRAAEARPWIDARDGKCRGCRLPRPDAGHSDGCAYAPLDSALAALKGST